MVNPYEKFMFASYSIGCRSIVLATMDEENLHPFRLRNAVNTFTCEFRNNLRSALLEDLQTNGKFLVEGKLHIRLDVGLAVYPLTFDVDYGKNVDIDAVVQKVADELRMQIPFYVVFSNAFCLQGGESL